MQVSGAESGDDSGQGWCVPEDRVSVLPKNSEDVYLEPDPILFVNLVLFPQSFLCRFLG